MARTSKSRGSIPFSMRSGNKPSPNKFLKGLGKKVVGGINKVFGGGAQQAVGIQPGEGGGMTGREAQMMADQRMMGKMNVSNLPPGGALYGGPMAKKEGYTPYKTDAILVRGAYDSASGKGTAKYGQIAKARAHGDISREVGETTGIVSADIQRSNIRNQKQNWKEQAKLDKWKQKKSKKRKYKST